ncbi:MAG: glycosyltransferase family 1 protein [Hyphomicrobiales bacterium]|nr:MAG: glycosyltransferase family 1 protein [Hyphomicrobiales bacterium]
MAHIVFNLLFIDDTPLTGPGYYAVQTLEHVLSLNAGRSTPHQISVYVKHDAQHHFGIAARQHLIPVKMRSNRFLRVLWEQIAFPFQVRRAKGDLIFSPAFVSPLWGARYLVVTIHDMYYRVVPEMCEPMQLRYWSAMIPPSARRCDRIIAVSHNSKKDIEHYLPFAKGRTVAIPLASRFTGGSGRQAPATARARPYVLMVANLTPNKNCEVLVKAVKLLNAKGVAVEFIHAGKDNTGLLEASIERLDASDYVTSLGKVSDEALEGLYRGCLAIALPSFYEGFGLPALEAQAMGAPLIASDRGPLPEVGGEAALYFDPDDAEALAAHIETLLGQSASEREAVVERSIANAGRFSWERTGRETLAVFDGLLQS